MQKGRLPPVSLIVRSSLGMLQDIVALQLMGRHTPVIALERELARKRTACAISSSTLDGL